MARNAPRATFDGLLPAPAFSDGVAYLDDGGQRIPLGSASRVMRDPRGPIRSRLERLRDDYDPEAPEPTPNHDLRQAEAFRRYLGRHIPHNTQPREPRAPPGAAPADHGPPGRRTRFDRQAAFDEREARRRARFPEPVGSDGLLEQAEEEQVTPEPDISLLPPAEQQAFHLMFRVFGEFVEHTKQYTCDIMALPEILRLWKHLRPQLAKPLAGRRVVGLSDFLTELVEMPLHLSLPKLIESEGAPPELLVNAFLWPYTDKERQTYYEPYMEIPLSEIMKQGTFVGFAGDFLSLVVALELVPPAAPEAARTALGDVDFREYVAQPENIGAELRRTAAGERLGPPPRALPLRCRVLTCKLQWYTGGL